MVKVKFKQWDCILAKHEYRNGQTAIELLDAKDHSRIAVATVAIDEAVLLNQGYFLAEGEVLIKDYSENEGMLKALEAAGVVKASGQFIRSGFVQIPLCKLLVSLD